MNCLSLLIEIHHLNTYYYVNYMKFIYKVLGCSKF